jgi:hypothetical protein
LAELSDGAGREAERGEGAEAYYLAFGRLVLAHRSAAAARLLAGALAGQEFQQPDGLEEVEAVGFGQ